MTCRSSAAIELPGRLSANRFSCLACEAFFRLQQDILFSDGLAGRCISSRSGRAFIIGILVHRTGMDADRYLLAVSKRTTGFP